MADDRSILSGDEADLMSCNSVEYRTALGSVMEDDPQGQPGSNPQIPWHHMYYQGDTGQMAPPENFFDERPPDGGFYEPFDQTGAQRPMYDSAPLQQPTAQYMDHVLPSAPPMVTVEDWDEGQNDFVLEHYQHGGVNADLTMQHPVREELSMLCPNFLLEDRELDDNFLANLEYSTAPWTHLSVEGGGTSVASELHHINPSDSSREPSAGMRSGSGRSSLLDGADNGTSYTSAEPYQQNMADSMMTERPPLIAQNVSYAAQWNESPTGTIFSHDTLSLERTPRNPVTTRSEWSAIDEYRARFVSPSGISQTRLIVTTARARLILGHPSPAQPGVALGPLPQLPAPRPRMFHISCDVTNLNVPLCSLVSTDVVLSTVIFA
jgi:hypothetical protein